MRHCANSNVMKFMHLQWFLMLFLVHIPTHAGSKMHNVYYKAVEAAKESLQKPVPIIADEVEYIRQLSAKPDIEDSFHIVNVCSLADRMMLWKEYLPQVAVHYAVKTNHDPIITKVMANLGAGFDCASAGEMRQALQLGVNPKNIIFSHPRKPITELILAEKNNIKWMVFDSIEELDKMINYAPSGEYLLRIKTHDEHSATPLSTKFGASLENAYKILDYAYKKNAPIVGISFHVGSNNLDATAFTQALMDSSLLFKYSKEKWNHPLTVLDLGGGWPGNNDQRFIHFANTVKRDLIQYFPKNVQVIAEPGRYFATQTTTAAVRIIGTEEFQTSQGSKFSYYLSNGAYGLFLASLYYQYDAKKIAMEDWSFQPLLPKDSNQLYPSKFWGPTCDSGDLVLDDVSFPRMHANEFIYSKNVGSYTSSLQTSFNQITPSKAYYVCKE
jgi:diaminopimelate decarboxylase